MISFRGRCSQKTRVKTVSSLRRWHTSWTDFIC
jgi:hypothetical protein